jgi:hypothetical protein
MLSGGRSAAACAATCDPAPIDVADRGWLTWLVDGVEKHAPTSKSKPIFAIKSFINNLQKLPWFASQLMRAVDQ